VGKILKFADDTKIFFDKVGSANDIYISLRNDLNNLVSWSKWQMLFNVEKCKVMHIGYNNCCAEYGSMYGNKLETASEEKNLGVMVSDNLKCDKQCSETVIKANKILGMIKRDFAGN